MCGGLPSLYGKPMYRNGVLGCWSWEDRVRFPVWFAQAYIYVLVGDVYKYLIGKTVFLM